MYLVRFLLLKLWGCLQKQLFTESFLIKMSAHFFLCMHTISYFVTPNDVKFDFILINSLRLSHAYMCHEPRPSLVLIMACRLFGDKPLCEPMLYYCQLNHWEQTSVKMEVNYSHFHSRKSISICHMESDCQPFCLSLNVLILKTKISVKELRVWDVFMSGICIIVDTRPSFGNLTMS